jgi:hypothetical protein
MTIGTKKSPAPVCNHCGVVISEVADACLTCGEPLAPPNVRSASTPYEKTALEARYQKALSDGASYGSSERLGEFSQKLKTAGAVFNVDISFLHAFVTSDKALYTSYSLGVRGQLRKPAKIEDDRQRLAVEGIMFGSYGEKIRYAALSLNGPGLTSYGPYSVRLRDVAIDKRASLLEDNSYAFVKKHQLTADKQIPPGYRCTWEDREKLALAKLSHRLASAKDETQYPEILLFSEGKYETDDFIEVHIYGPFDSQAIESVVGSSKRGSDFEIALAVSVKEHLANAGRQWIEE